jgi:putative OPT family oligopeptide transporter
MILAGIWSDFNFWITSLIAMAGGLFGILLMIPMRRVFIVENDELKYPEGVACAEVLRAGSDDALDGNDEDSSGLTIVILGITLGGAFKFAASFLGLLRSVVEGAVRQGSSVFYFGSDISPALLAVGFIVGLPIAVQIFIGGAIGWLIGIPLLSTAGLDSESSTDMAWTLWSEQIRYMGVGAMLVGGIESIWRVRAGLVAAVEELLSLVCGGRDKADVHETERNLSGATIAALALFCVALIAGIYYVLLQRSVGLTVLITVIMLIMSFFFAAVASYIVGLVGNSNSPVSGMTITAVLGTGGLILLFGFGGQAGMVATLGVAGVVCCVACTAGDVCNDLKTGHLVGASPRNQQIMQIIGVLAAAFIMAPVMTVLHQGSLNAGTGGIGGRELSAPQASLFASLVNGFFGKEDLPEVMVFWGVGIGIAILFVDFALARMKSEFRLHVMPVAVGIYLPFGLAVPILLGGVINWLVGTAAGRKKGAALKRGILITSGLIAGESLIGVVLGGTAYMDISSYKLLSEVPGLFVEGVSVIAMLAVACLIYVVSLSGTEQDNNSSV